MIEFKQDDFNLDFNSAVSSSDKSTTDNFLSDEGDHKIKSKRRVAKNYSSGEKGSEEENASHSQIATKSRGAR
jgi:hypothetical protein